MENKKIYVGCRENGDIIEEVKTIEEGKKLIGKYEKQDKKDGIYEENFYDIINEKRESLIN